MNPDTLHQLSSLERRFGSFLAVDKIDFEVKRGEIFALLGPNGAGKTTTMRMITGTLQADAGKAEIGGHDCFA
jgi:ABC-2 type transport system ATP-binding protein